MKWYEIKNLSDNEAEILIYEQIGKSWWDDSGISAKTFVNDIRALAVNEITLRINSPGGDVFEGNSIYNALVEHEAKVFVKIDGIAASVASIIAMAGDSIEMAENSMMMIHDPWTFAMGSSTDMQKTIEMLDRIKVGLVSTYHNKTGVEKDEISALMTDETWFTAEEAVEFGFADSMVETTEPVKARFFNMFNQFNKVPKRLLNGIPAANINATEVNDMADKKTDVPEISLEIIKSDYPDIVAAISAEVEGTAKADGAKEERERIQSVFAQLIPGHEMLIEALAWDGKTTGPEAAVQVLAAENTARKLVADNLDKDAPDALDDISTDGDTKVSDNEPLAIRCQKEWDVTPALHAEFTDFEAFVAYKQATEDGFAKTLK